MFVKKISSLVDLMCYTIQSKLYNDVILYNGEVIRVEISYKKLWKILIDKDMKKKNLQANAGISWASVTKLSKGENVSMDVLIKVCKALECDIGDIVELVSSEIDSTEV